MLRERLKDTQIVFVEENPRHQTYCQIGNGGFKVQKTGKYELQSSIRSLIDLIVICLPLAFLGCLFDNQPIH